ncbi:MAG: YbaB/EbfC family nucleoid-associated protein [Acidiferrobacterales bacterium]
MKGGLGNIMKQAQMMQENLRKAQEQLAQIEVTGSAGSGMVTVTMTCRHDVRRVHIDPGLMQDDREVLEDLVAAAMNDAVRKAEQQSQERMAGLTAGLSIPGLNLPF